MAQNPDLPPQGVLRFPGLMDMKDWSYSLHHGTAPGVAQCHITPQEADLPSEPGTMTIEFGTIVLSFDDCIIDLASVKRDSGTGTIISVSIKDRRWRWQYKQISGCYNVRLADGSIDMTTQKNPQELAKLLLKAMDEQDYDVSQLDATSSPAVDWADSSCPQELEKLVAALGCRVVLQLDGTVLIALLGQGSELPRQFARNVDYGMDPPDQPGVLRVVGGQTRYQDTFRLKAVGREPDDKINTTTDAYGNKIGGTVTKRGDIKPLDKLSYFPVDTNGVRLSAGFGGEAPSAEGFLNVADLQARVAARESIFRLYVIASTADTETDGEFNIPGYVDEEGEPAEVTELRQILPLEEGLCETYDESVLTGFNPRQVTIPKPLPAHLYGLWWAEQADGLNNSASHKFPYGFTIDKERGMVTLPFPVSMQNDDGTYGPAELFLTVAHGIRALETREFDRYKKDLQLNDGQDDLVEVLKRDDIIRIVVNSVQPTLDDNGNTVGFEYDTSQDNSAKCDQEANYYLQAALAGRQIQQTGHVEYAGIIPWSPDGANHQVEWRSSGGVATTGIGRNMEFSLAVPTYKERQRIALDPNWKTTGLKPTQYVTGRPAP